MKSAVLAASIAACLGTSACSSPADPPAPQAEPRTETRVAQDLATTLSSAHALAAKADAGPGYTWPTPAGWFDDFYAFPLPFAPSLPYTGIEALRQAPGFGDPTSPEYWSYTFAFWVDGDPKITAASLERDMVAYYLGLAGGCTDPSFPCDASKFEARFEPLFETGRGAGAVRVFGGKVGSYDMFFTGQPMTLQMIVSTFDCPRDGHRAVLFSASPAGFSSPVWRELLERQVDFRCE
jgi:hypothetical protein